MNNPSLKQKEFLTLDEFIAQGHACMDEIFGRMAGERPRLSFRSGYVRVVRKQKNTQHAPMAFVDDVMRTGLAI